MFERPRWYLVGDADPDRPFGIDDYITIASDIVHHGRCDVWAASLPYGMWWQELRPQVELHRDVTRTPDSEPAELQGVWIAAEEFIGQSHPDYQRHARRYVQAPWLDAALSH